MCCIWFGASRFEDRPMSPARPEVTGKKPGNADAGGDKTAPGPPQLLAYSIQQFCQLHGISVDFYFKLQRRGLGPRVMDVGARTLISHESAADWRREREQAATQTQPPALPTPESPPPPRGRGPEARKANAPRRRANKREPASAGLRDLELQRRDLWAREKGPE
jgi:hypothetical protein